jgi:DNA-binding GntR family transcriptional regulator
MGLRATDGSLTTEGTLAVTASANRTTQSWVTQVLRERIITGVVPPGAHLRQVDIAGDLGVSTTPVREAFRSLATEGLVQIDEHRGVVVRKLTLAECIEMQELIILVEADNLLYAVPNMDSKTLAEAESLCRRMDRAGNRYGLLNCEFHLAMARPSGRQRSLSLLGELLTLSALHVPTDSNRIAGRRKQAQAEHYAMVAAARAGDAAQAADILRHHCQPILVLLRRDLAATNS